MDRPHRRPRTRSRSRASYFPCVAAVWLAGATFAQAQAPDAELLRQQARDRALRAQQEPGAEVRRPAIPAPATDTLPEGESPCFQIERLQFDEAALQHFPWAPDAADAGPGGQPDRVAGRCLGVRGIDAVTRRVQQALLQRGYVTSTVRVSPQNLSERVLRLEVLAGRVRSVRLAPDADALASLRQALTVSPGSLLNLREVEQMLENLQRLPTVEAGFEVVPSTEPDAQPGDSDLVVQWRQRRPWRLQLSLDDGGARETGRHQITTTFAIDHPLSLNDLVYLSLHRAAHAPDGRGNDGFTLHYEMPWGWWLGSFTTGRHRHHQAVAGASEVYRYGGESRDTELALSRVIYRDAVHRTTLKLAAWHRSARSFIDDAEIEVQRRRTAGWQLGVAHRAFVGPGTLDAQLQLRRGTGAAGALRAVEEPFGEGSSRMQVWNAEAQWSRPWAAASHHGRWQLGWRAQWNGTPLVPQDRFAIAGRHTVRGFDGETVLSGDRGWLLRSDAAWSVTETTELYLALDHGAVGGRAARALPGRRLTGAAIGWRGAAGIASFDLFAGRPLSAPAAMRAGGLNAGFSVSLAF